MGDSETRTTTDHDEIREWVQARQGFPAAVRGTGNDDAMNFDPGELRIDVSNGAGEDGLIPLSWDDWFDKFDREQLAFVYQEGKTSGDDATYYELVAD